MNSNTTIARLEQNNRLAGRRVFRLKNTGILEAEYYGRGQSTEISIEVGRLDLDCVKEKRRSIGMIFGTFVFALLGITFAIPGCSKDTIGFLFVALFFWLFAFVCWIEFKKQSYDIVIFQDPFSGRKAIFHRQIPNAEEVQEFIDKLCSEIKTKKAEYAKSQQTLPEQINQLAAMKESGMLTEEEFKKAKEYLIGESNSSGSFGFGFRQ
ncbi:MAG: hypothetical protein JXR23_05220 [Pontiellaceae bacterium]|nr:hypothetical protein [Pontiellaceae bacterium]